MTNIVDPMTVRERAVSCASKGYAVFPVKVRWEGTEKIVAPIAAWPQVSTSDVDRVRAWWAPGSPWYAAVPAIDCGKSGVVVADLDLPDGPESWRALDVEPYPWATVATPSGGRHLYYRADPEVEVRNSSGLLGPGIDVRGAGGFVFAWGWADRSDRLPPVPVVMLNGHRPSVVTESEREESDPFGAPGRLFTRDAAEIFCRPHLEALRGAVHGEVNTRLNDAAVVLGHFAGRAGFWSTEEATELLMAAQLKPWHDADESAARKTIRSGLAAGARSWTADLVEEEAGPAGVGMVAEVGPVPGEPVDARKAVGSGFFTDSMLADLAVREVLLGKFIHVPNLGWLRWDGKRWASCTDIQVIEVARRWAQRRFRSELDKAKKDPDRIDMAGEWKKVLSAARLASVVKLTRGLHGVDIDADTLDADPDLMNTPAGVVDLRTGTVVGHDPRLMMTKLTRGSYVPGLTHLDWETALDALRPDTREWFRIRVGQAATGHPVPDGRLVVLQGGGANGKSLVTTDGIVRALGDYADVASHKLFAGGKRAEHSTERADLRGKRLLVAEELSEGRSIDVQALKQIQDVGTIKARFVFRDNISFPATHTLFVTTNYVPIVAETDHGTWRRLCLLRFPYRFRRAEHDVALEGDRPGDPGLKPRLRTGADGRHDAVVTWVVRGAMDWYLDRMVSDQAMDLPASVALDTQAWRVSADRVLGYATERLEAAPGACVIRSELLGDFNLWLAANGHSAWPKETFGSRFEGHEHIVTMGVHAKTTRDLSGLSRPYPQELSTACPVLAKVWWGVRFRRNE